MKRRTIPDTPPPDPHTTEDKAALCDVVAPFVTSLLATTQAQVRARAPAVDPLTLALARLCAREVNRLMRGEPQLPFLKPVRFAGESVPPASLAAGLGALDAALGAFRRRYFGWHQKVGVAAWFISGPDGDTAAWRQLTRPQGPPPGISYPRPDDDY